MPRFYENHTLSHREGQVIELAGKGLTDLDIARELGISESTVTTYWDRIRLKYGAHHRTELVLRVHQEKYRTILSEMRMENQRLLARLKQVSGPLLHEIFEGVEEAVIVIDETERIRFVNELAATMFGLRRGEMEGGVHSILVPEELRKKHEEGMRSYLAGPAHQEMGDHVHTWARYGDGRFFQIHAVLTPLHSPQGTLVMCSIRDSTEPRQYFDSIPEPASAESAA